MPETHRLLEMALKGLEAERAKLDEEIAQIKKQLNGGRSIRAAGQGAVTFSSSPVRKRRRMSAEARRRISEGMKRRYAELRRAVKAGKK
jgi:hypothetical protein